MRNYPVKKTIEDGIKEAKARNRARRKKLITILIGMFIILSELVWFTYWLSNYKPH